MSEIPDSLIDRLGRAHRVVFATGAGISAESGVPTFRGEGGIWNKMRPEELASVDGFMRNPQLVWEWYQHRRDLMSRVVPNPGHFAIAAFEKYFPESVVITQNIDGLHRQAGSSRILELHGDISRNKCFECGRLYDGEIDPDADLPRCGCGGMIRPDVVWFGEMLPHDVLQAAFEAAEAAEVFFAIGTSAVVQPAASLPLVAARRGACLVEVNLEPTPLTPVADVFLQGKSGEILPRLLEQFESRKKATSGDEKTP
jgi:NAD-dependent deacetylase